jgi:hypothetical protein
VQPDLEHDEALLGLLFRLFMHRNTGFLLDGGVKLLVSPNSVALDTLPLKQYWNQH